MSKRQVNAQAAGRNGNPTRLQNPGNGNPERQAAAGRHPTQTVAAGRTAAETAGAATVKRSKRVIRRQRIHRYGAERVLSADKAEAGVSKAVAAGRRRRNPSAQAARRQQNQVAATVHHP